MAKAIKLSDEARNYARKVVRDYPSNIASIKEMELALRVPWKETDDNIGGSRVITNISPVETEFDRVWTNDLFLKTIKEVKAFEKVWDQIEDSTAKDIIAERYFNLEKLPGNKRKMQTWVKISHKIEGCSEDTCRKIEKSIIERLAEELQLV